VTLCGLGSERLAARLEELIGQAARPCRGIISFGTAGGLEPALPPGACVIADEIAAPAGRYPVDAGWLRALQACLPEATRGTLAGVDQPMFGAADKARLWQSSGARAVDMESHRAALVAQRHGVPFAACRVVVDPAHRSLPAAATAGLREDGTTALMQVVRALAAHPGQLPALIRLASDADAAKRTLRVVRARVGRAFAMPLYPGRQYAANY
jgi:hopanoid-associated phosphorylase